MNLLQASYLKVQSDIHAGGPGSGRRLGGGSGKDKPVHEGTHKRLISRGWKFDKNVSDGVGGKFSRYTKPDSEGNEPKSGKDNNRILHVDKNGSVG